MARSWFRSAGITGALLVGVTLVAVTVAVPTIPCLTDYWAQRRRRNPPPLDTATLRL